MSSQANIFPTPYLSDLTGEGVEAVRKAKEMFKPVLTFALVSGGNDSTSMLHLVRKHIDAAVHINTGIGIPSTSQFVRDTCKQWDIPLLELQTDPSIYRDIVLAPTRKGFPGPAFHFITYHRLKSERLQNLQRDYSKRGQRILLVSGVRRSESQRRLKNIGAVKMEGPRGRLGRCCWVNPIVDFESEHLIDYRLNHNLPQCEASLLIHRSGECLCGAFAKKNELKEIEYWFPETGSQIRSMEKEAESLGKPYCRWGWGHEKTTSRPTPPLCSSCSLFEAVEVKAL